MTGEQDSIQKYDWVGTDYRAQTSTQAYGERIGIEGVEFIDLPLFSDEGGDFCEITRFAKDGTLLALPGYRPAQISYSYLEPNTIKAWHLHHRQDDLWFVPPHDRLLVGLLDVREKSPTYRGTMRFVLGAGKSRLLLIPRGVAHGCANLGTSPVAVLYFVNRAFDPDHPDEHRLPHDVLAAEFWSILPG